MILKVNGGGTYFQIGGAAKNDPIETVFEIDKPTEKQAFRQRNELVSPLFFLRSESCDVRESD